MATLQFEVIKDDIDFAVEFLDGNLKEGAAEAAPSQQTVAGMCFSLQLLSPFVFLWLDLWV